MEDGPLCGTFAPRAMGIIMSVSGLWIARVFERLRDIWNGTAEQVAPRRVS